MVLAYATKDNINGQRSHNCDGGKGGAASGWDDHVLRRWVNDQIITRAEYAAGHLHACANPAITAALLTLSASDDEPPSNIDSLHHDSDTGRGSPTASRPPANGMSASAQSPLYDITALMQQLTDAHANIAVQEEKLVSCTSTITAQEAKLRQGAETLAGLDTQLTHYSVTIAALESKLSEAAATIAHNEELAVERESQHLVDLQRASASLQETIRAQQARIEFLESEMQSHEASLEDASAQVLALQVKLKAMSSPTPSALDIDTYQLAQQTITQLEQDLTVALQETEAVKASQRVAQAQAAQLERASGRNSVSAARALSPTAMVDAQELLLATQMINSLEMELAEYKQQTSGIYQRLHDAEAELVALRRERAGVSPAGRPPSAAASGPPWEPTEVTELRKKLQQTADVVSYQSAGE